MATVHSHPTHVEVEKARTHFTLYLRHSSLPGNVCCQKNKSTELRLIPRII